VSGAVTFTCQPALIERFQSSVGLVSHEPAKILFSLRHDLDIHCLIGVNASEINKNRLGRFVFGHLAMRVLESIVLAICKVYEDEKRFELNSIQSVLNSLSQKAPSNGASKQTGVSAASSHRTYKHRFCGGAKESFEIATKIAYLNGRLSGSPRRGISIAAKMVRCQRQADC